MRSTFNITFYARESKKDKDGLVHIEMSITVNSKRLFINLPFQVEPGKFNSKRRPKEYDDYISLMRSRVNDIMVEMLKNGEPVTSERIRSYVRQGGYKSYTIEDLFNDYLEILNRRVGKDISKPVYRKYELVKEMFLEDNNGSDEATNINTHAVNMFYAKLRDKYQSATSAGYMTKLKTVVKYGLDNGKLKINPFNGVKITKEKKPIEYLTEEEISILEGLNLDNKSLQNVLDIFLFQASSGLSYADIVNLKSEDIMEDESGNHYIHKNRIKTGNPYTALILPTGMRILKKYDYSLNVISNQKLNSYLHIIERQIGFKKSLHSHIARHTYLTTLLNRGVRLEIVSKSAGHSSTKVTQQFYAHLEDSTIVKEVATALSIS